MQHNHQLTLAQILLYAFGTLATFVTFWAGVIMLFAVTGPNT